MIKADLHIHSHYSSDGEFKIIDIINKCLAQNIDTFSLTDHNSVKGVQEAADGAQQAGIRFIPGIEIDCNYEGVNLHLLGYHIDWKSYDFLLLEEDIASKVMNSFSEMIDNLHRLGFTIEADAVLDQANVKLPSGELIAGKPAFVPIQYMSFRHAVEMIKDNGGIPIVAHPGLNLKGREQIAEKLLDNGAKGLEVFNNYHQSNQISYFASLVQRQKAIMTCGSDFHGKTKPLINIGQFNFEGQFEDYLKESIYLHLYNNNSSLSFELT